MNRISRRTFTAALAAAGLRAAGEPRPTLDLNVEQRYRANAHVLLLGMTLLRRENVGAGSVVWRETEAAGQAARLLEFMGYSQPERAAGLNRTGLIRETRRERNGAREYSYFGLMTASPEESADAARKALHSSAKQQAYSAIDGTAGTGAAHSVVAHFTAAASEPRLRLVDLAREALARGQEQAAPSAGNAGTFLQTLAESLEQRRTGEQRYVYNGRLYRMALAYAADPKAGEALARRGLTRGSVLRITGRTRREAGGKESEFRLWIPAPPARPIPLRIEYQPKSYLRLIFEAESEIQ